MNMQAYLPPLEFARCLRCNSTTFEIGIRPKYQRIQCKQCLLLYKEIDNEDRCVEDIDASEGTDY